MSHLLVMIKVLILYTLIVLALMIIIVIMMILKLLFESDSCLGVIDINSARDVKMM